MKTKKFKPAGNFDRWYTVEEVCALLKNRIKPRTFHVWARRLARQNPTAKKLMGYHEKWHSPLRRTRWRLYHADLIRIYVTKYYLKRLSGFTPGETEGPPDPVAKGTPQ